VPLVEVPPLSYPAGRVYQPPTAASGPGAARPDGRPLPHRLAGFTSARAVLTLARWHTVARLLLLPSSSSKVTISLIWHAPSGRTSRILATSSPEQWERPTLCDRWRVHDVVAHLISYDDLDIPGLLRRLAVGRLNLNQTNAAGVAEYATASCEEL